MSTFVQIYRYRTLVKHLVLKDLALKYRGSAWGFLWSLLNPLLMIVVYWFAFQYVLQVKVANYTAFFICGFLPWTFFAGSCAMATGSIVDNAGLVKKVAFPRLVLPLATVLFNFVQFLIALVVFLLVLFAFFRDVKPAGGLLLLPIVLVGQALFVFGVAQTLAGVTVFFRDVRHLVEVGLQMLFWLTPILYPVSLAPEAVRGLLRMNPMTGFVLCYQSLLLHGALPDFATLLGVVLVTLVAPVVGAVVFRRWSPRFAEQV